MIRFIEAAAERTAIAREILEALTDWFEVEESREKFIEDSAQQPFWASLDGDTAEGFLCLKGYDVVCILPVGKAADDFHAPSKRPFEERVHFNMWR